LFSSPRRPDRLWGPPRLLSYGYSVVMRPGREAGRSLPSSASVKNMWTCPSILLYVFKTWSLVKHRDNFICFTPTRSTWRCSCSSRQQRRVQVQRGQKWRPPLQSHWSINGCGYGSSSRHTSLPACRGSWSSQRECQVRCSDK